MAKRRGRGEGSVERLADGRFRSVLSLGVDPRTGKRIRRKFYGQTKRDVLAKLREAQSAYARGQLVEPNRLTLGEWLPQWLAIKQRSVATQTWKPYERHITLYLIPKLGPSLLSKLQPVHVERFYSQLAADGVSTYDQSRAGATLSQALRHAVRLRLLPSNPAKEVTRPRHVRADIQPLSEEQVADLVNATADTPCHAWFVLAVDTGARPGELFALLWEDIALDAGTVRFIKSLEEVDGKHLVKDAKTTKSRRIVRVSAFTTEALRRHHRLAKKAELLHATVFCGPEGGYVRKSNFNRRVFQPAMKAAGISGARPYDLRHTCATLLLQRGVNVKVVSERLGHSDIRITLQHYAHVLPSMQEAAVAAIEGILRSSPNSPLELTEQTNTVAQRIYHPQVTTGHSGI